MQIVDTKQVLEPRAVKILKITVSTYFASFTTSSS